MTDIITSGAVVAFFQVVMIDLALAGDKRAIIIGVFAATVLRITFAGMATQLLQIFGLLPAGGIEAPPASLVAPTSFEELRRTAITDLDG
jgi:predicted tellurium resistance membrane protein TerC